MKPANLVLTLLYVLAISTVGSVQARPLPAVIELDRYLVEAHNLVHHKAFSQAQTWLDKARQLNIPLPPEYYFLSGKTRFASGHFSEAHKFFLDYLQITGRLGEHYQDVLGMLTALEKKQAEKNSEEHGKKEIEKAVTSQAVPKEAPDNQKAPLPDVAKVESRGSADNSNSGDTSFLMPLQQEINALLMAHAIYERYGVDAPTLVYSIKAGYGGMLVVTRSEQGMEGSEINSHNVTINSIPKKLKSACSWEEQRCWIDHPHNNQRWLEMSYNEEASQQLLSHLESLVSSMKN